MALPKETKLRATQAAGPAPRFSPGYNEGQRIILPWFVQHVKKKNDQIAQVFPQVPYGIHGCPSTYMSRGPFSFWDRGCNSGDFAQTLSNALVMPNLDLGERRPK